MSLNRRQILSSLAALGAASAAPGLVAQGAWPSKPIRIILPYTVGGSADALARGIAEHLRSVLGQPVIVESRPGANSALGAELVAKSPADGYTLLYLGYPTISTNLVVYKDVRYKLEDFQPITTTFRSPVSLTVKRDFPANNLKELMDLARKQGSLSYGTSGNGSSPHLLMEKIKADTGIRFEHIPYKGENPAVLDVLGGHLPLFAGSIATPQQHVRSGALKVIATSSAERLPSFPDVPTFREAGFPEHVFTYWHGFAAPAGTPRPIIDRLHAAIVAAMSTQPVRNVLGPDQIATAMSPEAFTEQIRKDIALWTPVIRASRIE
ncbi:tripartite tricarboxylate transporter substrate binding protein [Ramlibacter sp. AW1]|uniref:Tripartite tricarboxylate transporter substrate binding protein n=1 Tax=Ramlibacter aurantiacus TaxID=2801330 RepID=A0A937D6E7_9BURK|nr:tripartite tricarboxylate transporter substrate binding protein [Ramlibacter aurantiacus]MBL0420878.1 tripartite tricarboxylate transporter substrate binding protein [Ramlibacter aurantiacus]